MSKIVKHYKIRKMNPAILISMNLATMNAMRSGMGGYRSLGNLPDPKDEFFAAWEACTYSFTAVNLFTFAMFLMCLDTVTLTIMTSIIAFHVLVQLIFLTVWITKYRPLYD